MMRKLLNGVDDVDNYVDDVLGHTSSWEGHISMLREVFERIRQAGLTIKPSKCLFGYFTVKFLGHNVGQGKLTPQDNTVQRILSCSHPTTKKQLRSFLGLVGWYQKFIPNYSMITAPLTTLLQKKQPNVLKWNEEHESAFRILKKAIVSEPMLRTPDFSLPFLVQTDASETAIGAALLQKFGNDVLPVAFASRKLQPRETRYTVGERECLAIIFALKKFDRYLYNKEFILYTDHSSLTSLKQKSPENSRLLRWSLFLENYKFQVKAIKGKENVLADFLSRM